VHLKAAFKVRDVLVDIQRLESSFSKVHPGSIDEATAQIRISELPIPEPLAESPARNAAACHGDASE